MQVLPFMYLVFGSYIPLFDGKITAGGPHFLAGVTHLNREDTNRYRAVRTLIVGPVYIAKGPGELFLIDLILPQVALLVPCEHLLTGVTKNWLFVALFIFRIASGGLTNHIAYVCYRDSRVDGIHG